MLCCRAHDVMLTHATSSALLLLLTCIQSLRGRVAVNSDSVDSEDYYYYFPEVEDYEFVEEEDPEDLDDQDMEFGWGYSIPRGTPFYGPSARDINKQVKHDLRYANNKLKKAVQNGEISARSAEKQAWKVQREAARNIRKYGYWPN